MNTLGPIARARRTAASLLRLGTSALLTWGVLSVPPAPARATTASGATVHTRLRVHAPVRTQTVSGRPGGGAAVASPGAAVAPPGASAALPGAWILVDVDTGVVLDAHDERAPLPPASLTKILTALTVVNAVHPDASVPASVRAEAMPARKINMKAGQVWSFSDAFHAMMLSSANDAAVALAERADGTVERFSQDLARVAKEIGLQDNPLLQDPAGLDDAEFSINGGNLISARDLAIAARAGLANPVIAEAVANPLYRFHGPDGSDHKLGNHNQLLKSYPGAIGMKTGYTRRAGECLVAAARRDGRTMLAVVLHAPSVYANATSLLDRGFATPVGAEAALTDHLPPVRQPAAHQAQGSPAPAAAAASSGTRTPTAFLTHRAAHLWDQPPALAAEAALVGLGLLRLRARRRDRQRRTLRSTQWASQSLD